METVRKEAYKLIGIKVTTSNENGNAARDIGGLWNKFMSENIAEKVPNRVDKEVLSVYTNYQGDHTKPYDAVLGCRVSSIHDVPADMVAHEFPAADYKKFTSKGNLTEDAVFNTWLDIWNADLKRSYISDFEEYGEKAVDPTNGEIEIFVGVK